MFLDAGTVIGVGQVWGQHPVTTALDLRQRSIEEKRGTASGSDRRAASSSSLGAGRNDANRNGIQSSDINGGDNSPERRRLGNLSLESVLREVLKRRRLATVIRQADPAIIHARQATDPFEGDDQEEDL